MQIDTLWGVALSALLTFAPTLEQLAPPSRAAKHPGMALQREKPFALMSRKAKSATAYFCLPPTRVVEMG